MPSAECKVGCFGKLPIAGDFIRGNGGMRELEQLDAWIQEGMHRGQAILGSSWQTRFDSLGEQHFLFAPERSGAYILGRFQASRDSAGRRYPFVVAARIAGALHGQPASLPLAAADFLAEAAAMVGRGLDGHTVTSAIAAAQSLRCVPDFPAAEQSLAHDWRSTSLDVLLPQANQDASLLMQQLEEFVGAPPRYCLRWASRTGPSDIAFWLHLLAGLQQQAGGKGDPCLLMWPAGGAGVIRLSLTPLEARIFPGMLLSDLDDDHAYDLGRDHGDLAAATSARNRFADSLRLPDLASVLASVTTARRR